MKQRVVLMTTSPQALRAFFQAQIQYFSFSGLDIHTVSSPGKELEECRGNLHVPMHEVPMERRIAPWADIVALTRLIRKFLRLRPAIVHTHTPKAGFLGMIAAWVSAVPIRIYTINGLRFSTSSGWRYRILKAADKLACRLATDVLCVSHSLRGDVIRLGLCPGTKIRTLGCGGSHGVNTGYFDPDSLAGAGGPGVRSRYQLPPDAVVITYVGRIVRDKGIVELAAAWNILRRDDPHVWLFLCGEPESLDPVDPGLLRSLRLDPRVRFTGEAVDDMPGIYAASDISVLPSYREGLPNSVLESQSMRVPVVATRIAGTRDALQDGVTGLLVEPGNCAALADALKILANDASLRRHMGIAGRKFVSAHFEERRVSELLVSEYRKLLDIGDRRDQPAALPQPDRRWYRASKRIFDILAAGIGFVAVGPLLVAIAAAIRLSMGGPVLFRQTRGGLNGSPFTFYKFRSMTDARDITGRLLPDQERLTRVGRFLRATSLDELPQLWNVLRGDMSIVGPRPLLAEYSSRFSEAQRHRHDVKPGITGWAQVNGRNAISWEAKFALDLWYIANQSLGLDLAIVWLTVRIVLGRRGTRAEGEATMPEFRGTLRAPTAGHDNT